MGAHRLLGLAGINQMMKHSLHSSLWACFVAGIFDVDGYGAAAAVRGGGGENGGAARRWMPHHHRIAPEKARSKAELLDHWYKIKSLDKSLDILYKI